MPQNNTAAIVERIQLVRYYLAKGYNGREISEILAKKHRIVISIRHVNQEIKDIREGKYQDTWLDDLLDINYPQIYQGVIKGLNEDLDALSKFAESTENTALKMKAKKYHSDISINLLNALHKGPIVREMRKLKIKARKIVEELATERAITRRNQKEDELFSDDKQKPVVSPSPPGMDDTPPPFGI